MAAASASPIRRLCDEPALPGLLWAVRFDAHGRGAPVPADEEPLPLERREPGFVWLHFNLVDARVVDAAEARRLGPRRLLAAAFANDPHQRIVLEDGHAGGVVADLRHDSDAHASPTAGGRLHFVLSRDCLATGRHHPLASPDRVREAVLGGAIAAAPIHLIEMLVAPMIASMSESGVRLGDALDAVEDRVLEDRPGGDRGRLGLVRRDAVRLHRQLLGLRAVFHRLEQDGGGHGLPDAVIGSAAQLAQRLDSLDRDIVVVIERARLLQEELAAQTAERTDRQLHTLSVLTALFLPPTLVAGLFSINPLGLPLAEHASVSMVAVLAALLSALAAYLLIRRLVIRAPRD